MKLNKSLNYIAPLKTNDLIRMGNKKDGGYIVSQKPLKKVDLLLSFGMSDNWSFEEDFLRLNNKNIIHIYDHTVGYFSFIKILLKTLKRFFYFKSKMKDIKNKFLSLLSYHKIKKNKKIKHFQIKVSNKNLKNEENIYKILAKVRNKKVLLSIDIENDEYKIIKDIVKNSQFIHLLIIEFHSLNSKRKIFEKSIKMLKTKFDIIHLHGNNYTSVCNDKLPVTLEITLRNKFFYPILKNESVKKFPIFNLDYPNLKEKPEIKFEFSL